MLNFLLFCENKYYHIFISAKIVYSNEGVKVNLLDEIIIKEEVIFVLYNGYFETNSELTEFYSDGNYYIVE